MATIKKNWESDLRIAVTLKLDGVVVPVPDHNFVLRWCVCGGTKYYDCSFIDGVWKDCKPSDDGSKVLCFLNSPRLGIGELHCKYYDYAPDDDFSDKNMLTVTPGNVDIELVSGAGDDAYEIDVDLAIEISQAIADAQSAAANANEAAEYARETVERLADFDPKANTDLVVNITKNGDAWVADASFGDAYEYLINPTTGRVILHVQFATRYGDREDVYTVASVLDEEANGRGQGIIIAGGVIVGDNSISVEWSENAGFIGVVFSELALDEDTVPSDVSWLDTQQVATAAQDELLFTLLNKHRPMRINNALVVETSVATRYPRTVSVVSNNTLITYHLNADRTITKSSKELANAADVERAKSLSEALASEIGFANYGTIEIASSGVNVAGRSVTIRFTSYNELWCKNGTTRVVLPINAGTKYTLSQRDNLYYSIENNAIVQTSDVLLGKFILLATCDRGLIVGGRILEVTEHLSRINSIDPTRVAIVYDAEWVKHEAQQTQENYNSLWAAIQGNDIVTLDGEVVVGAFAGNAGISFTSILRYSDLNDAVPHGIGCTTYSIVSTNGVVQIDAKTSSISLDGPFVFIVREQRVGQATRLESTISISEILEKANMGKTVMMLLPDGSRAQLVKVGDDGSLTFVAVIDSVEHTYMMPNNGDTSTIVVHAQKSLAGGLLVVGITGTDDDNLTADHTAAEILAAHNEGRPVVAVYDGEVYQLASVSASLASFSLASADLEVLAQIDVDGDGGASRIFDEVQGVLTAGEGINIDGNVISATGSGGSGIESIEQTVTSEESGGINVVTVTTSDGTTTDFEIRNGKQGATGPKGDQGNSGYSGAAGELEVVNNLKDGGATSALSAEMGKELGELVERVENLDVVYPELLKRLPSGYTALDYIDNGSAGSGAVLDTGIVPNADDYRFVGSWRRTGSTGNNTSIISAVGTAPSFGQYKIIRNSTNNGSLKVCAYNKNSNATTVTLADSGTTAWHNYDLRVGKIVLDGVETALNTTTSGQLNNSMLLGDANYPQQIGRFLVFKGDALVAAFQPCKNSSNVYGMYDLVGEQFYGSANANAFSGGNESLMPTYKVVSGGILQAAIDKSKEDIEKSLIGGIEVLPANSRLDSDTTITSNKAGGFEKKPPYTVLSRASDGSGVLVQPQNSPGAGMAYLGLLAGCSSSDKFCITFEARKATSGYTSIDMFLNENYVQDYTPAIRVELTEQWVRYVFTDITMGDGEQGGVFAICSSKYSPANPFEIRNLSVLKAAPVTEISLQLENFRGEMASILRGKKVSIMGDSISTFEDADNGIYNAREFTVLASDITNSRTLQGYPTYYDIGTTIGGVEVTSAMVGVLTSFSPVSGDEGKSIGKPLSRNNPLYYNIVDIWWYRLVTELGGNVLQNVSWSGASMCSHEGNVNDLKTSYAWHDAQINKLATRDAEGNTITPDVVIIYRGTNDMTHSPYAKLTDFGAGSMSIPADDAVTDGFGFKEAYALTIKKVREKYPMALVICCTLNVFKRVNASEFPTNNGTNTLPEFNNAIREVADMMGCPVIEFDKDGITFENCYPTYINDSSTTPTHPNPVGHRKMAQKAIADVMKM